MVACDESRCVTTIPPDPEDDRASAARAVLVHPDGRRPVRVRARASGRHRAADRRPDAVHRRDPRLGRRRPSLVGGDRREPGAQASGTRTSAHPFGGGAILGERPLAADGIEPPATVDSYWGDGYGVARAERRFIAGDPQPTSDFRQVSVAADRRDAPAGADRSGVVQFDRRLTDDDFRLLGEWFRAVPGDGRSAPRFLRPLDHRPRIPAVLPDPAAVRRRRPVGLADIARRPAPSAPGPRGARDRRDEGQARPRRPVSLSASCGGSSSRVRRSTSR